MAMTFDKITPEEVGLTNYQPYTASFKPLDFYRNGKYIMAVHVNGKPTEYVQCGTAEYINGWLYGAVQTVFGQHELIEPKKYGYLVSVALLNNPSKETSICFAYTGKVAHDKNTVMREFERLLREAADDDDALSEKVYSWEDFFLECPDRLEAAGFTRLTGDDLTIQLKGVITLGLNCDEDAIEVASNN